jgi:hypothetical protein
LQQYRTLQLNVEATEKMQIPAILETSFVPLGAPLHKDGSSMSSIIELRLFFAMFGKDFGSAYVADCVRITIIVSVVEGGIPNGGYIGVLAITIYGFQ